MDTEQGGEGPPPNPSESKWLYFLIILTCLIVIGTGIGCLVSILV